MLDELIRDMKEKGLISVAPIKLIGKAKPVFDMMAIMANTEPEATDPDWWTIRLWIRRN